MTRTGRHATDDRTDFDSKQAVVTPGSRAKAMALPPTARRFRGPGSRVPDRDLLVDKDGASPLYLQVAHHLRREIMAGNPPPGTAIATEKELIDRFKVSRITIRKSVDLLVEQGLVSRRHGKGTFVEGAPVDYPLDELRGTTQVLPAQGRRWHSRVSEFRAALAGEEVARFLDVDAQTEVTFVCRVDFVEDLPVAVADIYVPRGLGERLTPDELERHPLYPLLRQKAGVAADMAFQTMRAGRSPHRVAGLLGLNPNDPCMIVQRVVKAADGQPIEYCSLYFRAEAIRFSVTLRRSAATDSEFAVDYAEHRLRP